MNLKRFFAKDMRTALSEIKKELGADAIIMSSKKVAGGIEIVAAIDNKVETSTINNSDRSSDFSNTISADLADDSVNISSNARGNSKNSDNGSNRVLTKQEKFADSLAALLARQEKNNLSQNNKENKIIKPQSLGSQGTFGNYAPNNRNNEGMSIHNDKISTSDNSQKFGVSPEKFSELSKEVESIRKLLQFQLAGLMKDERNREEPIRAMISRLLIAGGFSETIALKLVNKIDVNATFNEAWLQMARILENNINVSSDTIMKNGGAIALIGPTGVGKTTTLAKLAARFAIKYGPDQVALITTDHYRIGAQEQLQTYGRIMGCVVKIVDDISTLADILYSLRHKSLVLIDTAGFGQRDARLEQELVELERNAKVKLQHYLVLSGTSQRRVLEDAYNRFNQVGIDGLILTKVDESLCLGDVADLCISKELSLSYITTGQRVPEDIEVADVKSFVQRLMVQLEEDDSYRSNNDGADNYIKSSENKASWARGFEDAD
ncbi:MAG: flagellar biosynthesis protein FlhF [Succinivibrionaceae bacterium]